MPSSLTPGSLRQGDHACSWYSTDEHRDSVAAPFVSAGLLANERVLYLHTDSSEDSVMEMIRRCGTDTEAALADGSLALRPAADVYVPGGGSFDPGRTVERLEDEVADARRAGYQGLRIAAEMSWAIEGSGGGDLADYEHRANDVFDRAALTAICLYDRRRFPAGGPSPGAAHNLHVWPDAPSYSRMLSVSITHTPRPDGLKLEGEVDFATSIVLAEALTRVVDTAAGDVHIDLSGLRFIDIGAARLLARAARQLGSGRALVLDAPSRAVRRLLKVLDGRLTAGFVVTEDGVES
ncbi:MAG TPA: MEDS domain-containing protein [Actinomycetota bacterium]|nr:MEDS domain-containing protein [Actinomycetota bacterium]